MFDIITKVRKTEQSGDSKSFAKCDSEREKREENPRYIANRSNLTWHEWIIFIFIVTNFLRTMRAIGAGGCLSGYIRSSVRIQGRRGGPKMSDSQRFAFKHLRLAPFIGHRHLHLEVRGVSAECHHTQEYQDQYLFQFISTYFTLAPVAE